MAGIDEDEDAAKIWAVYKVVGYECVELLTLLAACLGVSVSGEVNEGPFFVDEEKVDESGATWFAGDDGEVFFAGQCVDEGGFPDVRASDECEFR